MIRHLMNDLKRDMSERLPAENILTYEVSWQERGKKYFVVLLSYGLNSSPKPNICLLSQTITWWPWYLSPCAS